MKISIFIKIILICLFCISCSKQQIEKSKINEKSLDLQVLEAYEEGVKAMEGGDVLYAAKNLMRQKHYSLNQIGHPNQH